MIWRRMSSTGSAGPPAGSSRPAGIAGVVLLMEDSTATSIGSSPSYIQPFVEKYGRRARIQRRLSPGLFGQGRGEALVVELDRDLGDGGEAVSELTRLAGLGAVAAAQRDRQADDDAFGAELVGERGDLAEADLGARAQDRFERRGQGA